MRWRTAAAIALPVVFLGYFFVYPQLGRDRFGC